MQNNSIFKFIFLRGIHFFVIASFLLQEVMGQSFSWDSSAKNFADQHHTLSPVSAMSFSDSDRVNILNEALQNQDNSLLIPYVRGKLKLTKQELSEQLKIIFSNTQSIRGSGTQDGTAKINHTEIIMVEWLRRAVSANTFSNILDPFLDILELNHENAISETQEQNSKTGLKQSLSDPVTPSNKDEELIGILKDILEGRSLPPPPQVEQTALYLNVLKATYIEAKKAKEVSQELNLTTPALVYKYKEDGEKYLANYLNTNLSHIRKILKELKKISKNRDTHHTKKRPNLSAQEWRNLEKSLPKILEEIFNGVREGPRTFERRNLYLKVFRGKYLEAKSEDKIAEELEMTRNKFDLLIHRGKTMLAEHLQVGRSQIELALKNLKMLGGNIHRDPDWMEAYALWLKGKGAPPSRLEFDLAAPLKKSSPSRAAHNGNKLLFDQLHIPLPTGVQGYVVPVKDKWGYVLEIWDVRDVNAGHKQLFRFLIAKNDGNPLPHFPTEKIPRTAQGLDPHVELKKYLFGYGPVELLKAFKPRRIARSLSSSWQSSAYIRLIDDKSVRIPPGYTYPTIIPNEANIIPGDDSIVEILLVDPNSHPAIAIRYKRVENRLQFLSTKWEEPYLTLIKRTLDLKEYLMGKRDTYPSSPRLSLKRIKGFPPFVVLGKRHYLPSSFHHGEVDMAVIETNKGDRYLGLYAPLTTTNFQAPIKILKVNDMGQWVEVLEQKILRDALKIELITTQTADSQKRISVTEKNGTIPSVNINEVKNLVKLFPKTVTLLPKKESLGLEEVAA
jgi:hypothetical protein